ncbi:DUF2142 domain-containing protein [Microbacterium sp. 2C]|uniref:DUF2142 domain-containing protein n=1 Tax=Microbacterium paulum TaxID=2707006 RepID=UPI0018C2B677|nr:DUF2142 domain-containing protein [Microbacterium paulum]MBG0717950.1 DUF2142 domain-containing protein [Microbacterium paulum]
MRHRRILHILAGIALPVAMLLALLAWAGSSPPGSSPDDDYHMASIWCASGDVDGRCEQTSSPDRRGLPAELVRASSCFAFLPDQSASCPVPHGMRSTDRGNWVGHAYPPYFYAVMNVFVTDDFDTSILLMRTFNAGLYVSVLTALFFLLPRRKRPLVVWTSLLTIVPLGTFLIPSVNPSGWAILSATGLWLAAWGFFLTSGTRKWLLAGMALLLLLIGAGARGDAAVYGVLALLAASVLGFRRDRRYLVELLLPLGLSIVAVQMFFSVGQSAIISGDTAVDASMPLSSLIFTNLKLLPQLWMGAFGLWGLGWLDTTMPGLVWGTTVGLFAALCFWGLRRGDWRKFLALAGVGLALIVVPMYILVHDGMIVGSNVQPRYVYPMLIIFGGIALVGFARSSLGLTRVQLIVAGAALALANAIALHTNMRRYITGLDVTNVNLNWPIDWWWNIPVSPMAWWLLGSAAFAAALALAIWSAARRPALEEAVSEPVANDAVQEEVSPAESSRA